MTSFISPSIRLIAGVALAGSGVLASAPRAQACSRLAIQYRLTASEVPVAGPIIIDAQCSEDYCDTLQPELKVTLDGQPVAGSLQLLRTPSSVFLGWTPTAALSAGKSYALELAGDARGELITGERVAIPSQDLRWPAPDLAALESTLAPISEPTGESYCCPDLVCGPVCFTERETRRAQLEIETPENVRPAQPGFVYRLRWQDAGAEQSSDWDRLEHHVHAIFQHTAERYCATLEARSLADGTVSSRELCQDPAPDAGYGETFASEYDPHVLSFGNCVVPPGAERGCDPAAEDCSRPPQRLLQAWCDAIDPQCPTAATRGHLPETCASHQAYCEAPSDAANVEPAPRAEDERDTDPATVAKSDDGCRLASRTGVGGGAWLLLGLAWLLVRARRRSTVAQR